MGVNNNVKKERKTVSIITLHVYLYMCNLFLYFNLYMYVPLYLCNERLVTTHCSVWPCDMNALGQHLMSCGYG